MCLFVASRGNTTNLNCISPIFPFFLYIFILFPDFFLLSCSLWLTDSWQEKTWVNR